VEAATTIESRRPRRRGDALNVRQAAFVASYLRNGGNATQAAISAGYSPRTAKVQGSALLSHPDVARELERARAAAAERIEASAERIVLELARLAFLDPAGMFDEAGELLPIHRMPADVRRCISSIDVEERTDALGRAVRTRKVRIHSKADALRLLAQIRGMLVERVQHEGPQAVTVSIGLASPRPITQAAPLLASQATIALAEKGTEEPGNVQTGKDAGQDDGRGGLG
jgi:phage terminase small subunit